MKNAWDLYFKKNDKLVLALCGSVSAWIDKNILSSTGFLGRESLVLNLEEMPLKDCAEFWCRFDERTSVYEKIKVLAVTGGIPRYLESISPKLTAEENIERLCFKETGVLFNEFEKIFSDLFGVKNETYKKIMVHLCNHASTLNGVAAFLGVKVGGDVSGYLDDLIKSGFISRDFTWKISDGICSNLSTYRIKDNYSRFYLKYILPKKERVKTAGEVVADNPYFQNKTTKQEGCQIDYMIQTKHNVLYVCEIRFSKHPVGSKAIEDVKQKIKRIKMPKQFSYRPVLIHVNGVSESVEDSQYFSNIIDFSELIFKL